MPKSMLPRSPSIQGHGKSWVFHLAIVSIAAATAFALLSVGITLVFSQNPTPRVTPRPSAGGDVARGKYVVEDVAMCGQCHTPLDENGSPDRARWLQGGPLPFLPAQPDSNWPIKAPRIGGTPLPASDADMIKLLTTGIWTAGIGTTGDHLRRPMPQFRMDPGDAAAVVAYLKSVNSQP